MLLFIYLFCTFYINQSEPASEPRGELKDGLGVDGRVQHVGVPARLFLEPVRRAPLILQRHVDVDAVAGRMADGLHARDIERVF